MLTNSILLFQEGMTRDEPISFSSPESMIFLIVGIPLFIIVAFSILKIKIWLGYYKKEEPIVYEEVKHKNEIEANKLDPYEKLSREDLILFILEDLKKPFKYSKVIREIDKQKLEQLDTKVLKSIFSNIDSQRIFSEHILKGDFITKL